MEDFKWHFNNFTSELITLSYRKFIKTDREYNEIQQYLDQNSETFEKVLNQLNKSDKQFAKTYMDKQNHQTACICDSLYMAGYEDCIRLLKFLGVL